MRGLPANKRLQFAVSGLLALSALFSAIRPASAAGDVPIIVNYPDSIASTGDSITRAYNTGSTPFTDAPANSWSTGTAASTNSHYSRILHDHPPVNGRNYNDAVTGAVMADLGGQVANAVGQGVQYVTILLGANDACADTEGEMTPVATYRAQFQAAMVTLSAGLPDARIYVLSVPDIYNLWFILKDNGSARFTWALFGICQSMLANPLSMEPADVERRNRVRQRVVDYNTQLAQVCAGYIHCRFDNNAVYGTAFVPSDVSTRDYFHPAIQGQAKLAEVTYWAGFDFRDGVAPASIATVTGPQKGAQYIVTITAHDNVGVAGIEYKIGSGPYIRYGGPVSLPAGSALTFRGVDVNGTFEEAQTISVGR